MAEKRLKIPQITITIQDHTGKTVKTRKYGPFIFKKKGEGSDSATWYLKDKSHKNWGSIYVAKCTDYMCVCNSFIDDKLHGLGIGFKLYQHLIDYYQILESDPNGSTSDKAKKVWKRLGALPMKGRTSWGSRQTRYRMISKINPPENKPWTGTIYISNMMSSLKQAISTLKSILSRSGSSIKFRKRPTAHLT